MWVIPWDTERNMHIDENSHILSFLSINLYKKMILYIYFLHPSDSMG
jgi:hypothetical protein